jgi:hypothetical protein
MAKGNAEILDKFWHWPDADEGQSVPPLTENG